MGRRSGKAFEAAFAAYMREKRGIRETTLNDLCKGNVAARPWECDVHGVSYSRVWQFLRYGAVAAILVGCAVIFLPESFGEAADSIQSAGQQVETVIGSSTGYSVQGWGVTIIGFLLLVVAMLGKSRTTHHVWVECKDRKAAVKRTDILKLTQAVEDIRANEQAKWKPNPLWFAATSTFDVAALTFAREAGVRCFQATMPATERGTLKVKEL